MFTQAQISKIVEQSKLSAIKIKNIPTLTAVRYESKSGFISGLILGYFINGELKLYDKFAAALDNKIDNIYAIILTKVNDKPKLIKVESSINYLKFSLSRPTPDDISLLPIKIIESELSARVFGLKSLKSSLVGNVYRNYSIENGISRKLDSDINYILIPHESAPQGNIKFLLSDVEFQIPDLKGWNPPKDKTIKKGCKVVFKVDSHQQHWLVLDVNHDTTSKRICRNSSNRYKDLITIQNVETGLTKHVYAKHLKLV